MAKSVQLSLVQIGDIRNKLIAASLEQYRPLRAEWITWGARKILCIELEDNTLSATFRLSIFRYKGRCAMDFICLTDFSADINPDYFLTTALWNAGCSIYNSTTE